MDDRRAIWQRTKRRMQVGLSSANVIGAATVFVFLTFLVPVPRTFIHDAAALWLNGVLSVVYVVAATVVATSLSPRLFEEIRRWFVSGRPADRHVRDLALRSPLRQAGISVAIWGVATILFTAVNVFESGTVAVQTAITVPLGGLASAAITYLLAEQFARDITAAALAGGAPEEPVGPGVGARVIVAWGLAAALPLCGYVLPAVSILVVGHWSPTHIAISLLVMAAVALALGGHVDKFVGDGLLAVFGAPRRQADHADQALTAALEVARAVGESFGDELQIGIGLSSGSVVAGNVGGGGRLEFSVIGDPVNVAARIEAATRLTGDAILASEQTHELLSERCAALLEERSALPLKGKSQAVSLFAPRSLSHDSPRTSGGSGSAAGRSRAFK